MTTTTTGPDVQTVGATVPAAAQHGIRVRVPFWQAVFIIWYRDILRYTRDRARLIGSLAQPILFLIVFGVGLSSAFGGGVGVLPPHTTYLEFMFPGVIGMTVLMTSIFSAMQIVWDREFGFLREILVAPIDRSAVAVGKALSGGTQAMIGGIIMLIFAPIVGVRLSVVGVFEMLALLLLLAIALSAFGIAIASRMRSMQGFQVIMNFLLMPMLFLSGALFPLQGLPAWMTVLTRFDPVTYAIAPVRVSLFSNSGYPPRFIQAAQVTIGGYTLPLLLDVAIVAVIGAAVLGFAIVQLRKRD